MKHARQIMAMVREIADQLGVPEAKIPLPIVGAYITVVDEYKIQNPTTCGKGATEAKFIIEEGRIEISEPLILHWDQDVVYYILFHEMVHHYLEITAGLGQTHGPKFQKLMNTCKVSEISELRWFVQYGDCYSWAETENSPNQETVSKIMRAKAIMQDLEEPEWAIDEFMFNCIQDGPEGAGCILEEFESFIEHMQSAKEKRA